MRKAEVRTKVSIEWLKGQPYRKARIWRFEKDGEDIVEQTTIGLSQRDKYFDYSFQPLSV